jgi:hypothetical protein
MKELIEELCDGLRHRINMGDQSHTVRFDNSVKPSDYWLPSMIIGRVAPRKTDSWFCEIFIDDVCIFREQYHLREGEDLQVVEGATQMRLLTSVFTAGVMMSKQLQEKFQHG